jgi:hypothetical protein
LREFVEICNGKPVCLVSYELFIFSVLDLVLRDPVFVLDFLCPCLDVSVKLNGHDIVSSIRFSFWSQLGVRLQGKRSAQPSTALSPWVIFLRAVRISLCVFCLHIICFSCPDLWCRCLTSGFCASGAWSGVGSLNSHFSTATRSAVLSLGFAVQGWVTTCVLFSIDFSSRGQALAFSAHQFSSTPHRCLSLSSEQVRWLLSFSACTCCLYQLGLSAREQGASLDFHCLGP